MRCKPIDRIVGNLGGHCLGCCACGGGGKEKAGEEEPPSPLSFDSCRSSSSVRGNSASGGMLANHEDGDMVCDDVRDDPAGNKRSAGGAAAAAAASSPSCIMRWRDFPEHIDRCPGRPMARCPFRRCKWTGDLDGLAAHIEHDGTCPQGQVALLNLLHERGHPSFDLRTPAERTALQ